MAAPACLQITSKLVVKVYGQNMLIAVFSSLKYISDIKHVNCLCELEQ